MDADKVEHRGPLAATDCEPRRPHKRGLTQRRRGAKAAKDFARRAEAKRRREPLLNADRGPGARESSLKLALAFCIIDLALMGTVAFNSNSVTILGDVLKEGTDTLAVLAAFLTVRAVRRSPNHRFAYGIGTSSTERRASIRQIELIAGVK
jgi:hypothetical protein